MDLFNQLKEIMTLNVGIIRNNNSLLSAIKAINAIEDELNCANLMFSFAKYELKNAICVAKLIANSALLRKNSIGAHFRNDDLNKNNLEGIKNNDKILAK
jgi:aspartate oxidase